MVAPMSPGRNNTATSPSEAAIGNSGRRISGVGAGNMGPPRNRPSDRPSPPRGNAATPQAPTSGPSTQAASGTRFPSRGGHSPTWGSGGGSSGDPHPLPLPRVASMGARKSDTGTEAAQARPAPGLYLRRASTTGVVHRELLGASVAATTAATTRVAAFNNGGSKAGGAAAAGAGSVTEGGSFTMSRRGRTEGGSFTLIRRDRDMLQHEKMLLLANKRRLEALLRGVVDMQQLHPPPPAAPSLEGGSGGGLSHAPASTQRASSLRSSISGTLSGGGLSGVVMSRDGPSSAGAVPRSSPYGPSLRSQILRALDESSSLEWHMSPSGASSGPLFAGGNGGWADGNTEARVQELSARLVQLQTELDVTKTRYESELRYRNTQASAATTHLLKQVADLDTQVDELQRALIAAEGRVFDLTAQNTDLRHFNQELSATVRDKTVALEEAVALLGPDAAKLCEANEGLRSQLREANLALAARERRIHDLECQAASRSKSLLVHAHKAIDALRALAGISSAGAGVGGGFGQGGGAGGALAALTNLAMALGDPHEGHGSGGRSVKTDMCGGGWQPPLSPSRHDSWSPVTPTGDTYSAGGASDKS